jgi:hypothetical protein
VAAAVGSVLINEVYYDPLRTGVDHACEWVELLNRTEAAVDLAGWVVADNHGSDSIPELTLQPGGLAVIAASLGFHDEFPEFRGGVAFVADGRIGNGLSNSGDRLSLLDPTGQVIDALSYGDDSSFMTPPCPDVEAGHSLERRAAGLDADLAADFAENESPSPGLFWAGAAATPSPTAVATPSPSASPSPSGTPSPSPAQQPTPTVWVGPPPASAVDANASADEVTTGGPTREPESGHVSPEVPGAEDIPIPGNASTREGPKVSMWLYAVICCSALAVGSVGVAIVRRLRRNG